MSRKLVRLLLIAATIAALWVAVVALWKLGTGDPTTWATLAAVLAVLAAVASAWSSQRVVELQEDTLEPNPVPCIDVRSRYALAQFRVTNKGGTSAHDVRIEWKRPLRTVEGAEVVVGNNGHIPVLAPGESTSVLIGGSNDMFSKSNDTTCAGTITFKNASGLKRSSEFVVSAEHERRALVHDEEEPKTHYQLQKLPDALNRISEEIRKIRAILERERQ